MTGLQAWRTAFCVAALVFIAASTLWWITQDPGPPSNRPARTSTTNRLILYP